MHACERVSRSEAMCARYDGRWGSAQLWDDFPTLGPGGDLAEDGVGPLVLGQSVAATGLQGQAALRSLWRVAVRAVRAVRGWYRVNGACGDPWGQQAGSMVWRPGRCGSEAETLPKEQECVLRSSPRAVLIERGTATHIEPS